MKQGMTAIFLLATVLLSSCGGGGGGSEDGVVKTYRGKTTSAVMNTTDAAVDFPGALFGGGVTQGMGIGEWSTVSAARLAPSLSRLIPHLERYSLKAASSVARSAAALMNPNGSEVMTVRGDISGSMVVTFWTYTANGNFWITGIDMDFNRYCDSLDTLGITWSGTMRLTPTSWYEDGFPAFFNVEWSVLLKDVSLALSVYGTVSYFELWRESGGDDYRKVFEWDSLLMTDPLGGMQAYFVNLRSVDQDYMSWSHALEDLSGRVYLSTQGYVDLETQEYIETMDVDFDDAPSAGILKITGKDGASATFTFSGTAPEVSVEVDANADGSPDLSGSYAWDDIVLF